MMDKIAYRKLANARRDALTAEVIAEKSRAACLKIAELNAYKNAWFVLSYKAFGNELRVNLLDELAREAGKKVAYPICLGKGIMIAAIPKDGAFYTDSFGIQTPVKEDATVVKPEDIDLIIVPGVAFDKQLRRVGWGAGYYDRFLPQCLRAVKIAVGFQEQVFDQVPYNEWDKPVDMLVTDSALYGRCGETGQEQEG